MPNIYLIRHTKPDVAKGVCYGKSDVPLAASFSEEAKRVKEKLSQRISSEKTVFLTSPLLRCYRLAQYLSGLETVWADAGLEEMNFGDWEMQPWGAIDDFLLNAWMRDFVRVSPPNGENFEEVAGRSMKALENAIHVRGERSSNLVITAHSGVIRGILASVLEMPFGKAFSLEIDYGSISVIRWDSHSVSVLGVNC